MVQPKRTAETNGEAVVPSSELEGQFSMHSIISRFLFLNRSAHLVHTPSLLLFAEQDGAPADEPDDFGGDDYAHDHYADEDNDEMDDGGGDDDGIF